MMARTIPTSIRLTKEEKKRIERLANREGTGITTVIQDIIKAWVEAEELKAEIKKNRKLGIESPQVEEN